jgi:hypothetical protein
MLTERFPGHEPTLRLCICVATCRAANTVAARLTETSPASVHGPRQRPAKHTLPCKQRNSRPHARSVARHGPPSAFMALLHYCRKTAQACFRHARHLHSREPRHHTRRCTRRDKAKHTAISTVAIPHSKRGPSPLVLVTTITCQSLLYNRGGEHPGKMMAVLYRNGSRRV